LLTFNFYLILYTSATKYLRAYCADEPTAWVNLQHLARFAYNNSINAATKTTPNNLLFGMNCSIRLHVEGNVPRERILEAYHARDGEEPLPMPDLATEEEWEIQEIRDSKRFGGALYYLVKWTCWPSEYDSWEPAEHLANAPKKVTEFEKTRKRRRQTRDDSELDEGDEAPDTSMDPRPVQTGRKRRA
jgi:hypothetical protein